MIYEPWERGAIDAQAAIDEAYRATQPPFEPNCPYDPNYQERPVPPKPRGKCPPKQSKPSGRKSRWVRLKDEVVAQRGARCENCHIGGPLHLCHKSWVRKGREVPEDVELLCRDCHERLHPQFAKRMAALRGGQS